MCSDHANVSANQRGGGRGNLGWVGEGGVALARRGELNKDVSRPDRGGVREGVSGERHAWKVIKAA